MEGGQGCGLSLTRRDTESVWCVHPEPGRQEAQESRLINSTRPPALPPPGRAPSWKCLISNRVTQLGGTRVDGSVQRHVANMPHPWISPTRRPLRASCSRSCRARGRPHPFYVFCSRCERSQRGCARLAGDREQIYSRVSHPHPATHPRAGRVCAHPIGPTHHPPTTILQQHAHNATSHSNLERSWPVDDASKRIGNVAPGRASNLHRRRPLAPTWRTTRRTAAAAAAHAWPLGNSSSSRRRRHRSPGNNRAFGPTTGHSPTVCRTQRRQPSSSSLLRKPPQPHPPAEPQNKRK